MESVWSRVARSLFDPNAWLLLIAAPLPFALLACFVATNAWKLLAWSAIDASIRGLLDLPALVAQDIAFYMAAVGLVYLAQFTWWIVRLPIRVAGLWVIATSLANFISLVTTDEPMQFRSSEFGLQLIERVGRVIADYATANPFDTALIVGILAIISLGARLAHNNEANDDANVPLRSSQRKGFAALPPLLWAGIGGLVAVVAPIPESSEVARLANNQVLINTVLLRWNPLAFDSGTDLSTAVNFGSLVEPGIDETSGNRSNVVLIVLEAAGHRYSGLEKSTKSRMPTLATIANRGAWSNRAYTPMPNTTKSLYAIHCGRMPLWQSEHREITEENRVDCLADALSDAGYATAWFQSALGSFEDRPRFAAKLGFNHFEAWENIKGEPSGYRGSDDLSLAGAFRGWLAERERGEAFFATLVTSSPHDPYYLSPAVAKKLSSRGYRLRNLSSQKRYALLVLEADALIEQIVKSLEKRGLIENTIVAVVADHGEGFGDHEVKFHDNNYYDESLRVPFVLAGPGVRAGRIEGAVSLLDLAPTVVGLLDLPSALDETLVTGRDLFAKDHADRTLLFSCFYDDRCYGAIRGTEKVVILPKKNVYKAYNLASDPMERLPVTIEEDDPRLAEVQKLMSGYRLKSGKRTLAPVAFPTDWRCEENAPCKHPDSPRGGVFNKD